MFNHELIQSAGVKPRHISRILGVSRVTASNWLRGVTRPHYLVAGKAAKLSRAVERAVADGALPVSDQLPVDERSVKTVATVNKYLMEGDNAPEEEV